MPAPEEGQRLRAACLQMRLAPTLDEAAKRAEVLAAQAKAQGASLALLPEYWFMPARQGERVAGTDPSLAGARDALQRISRDVGLTLAGNAIEPKGADGGPFNTVHVFDDGEEVLRQRKVHPMPLEERWGLRPARDLPVQPWGGTRLGALVCADVLHPEAARILALRRAEVVLVPVMSWRKPNDTGGEARRAMFVARAYDNACFVLKAGSVASMPGNELVGRSLIAAPWGLLAQARSEDEEEVLVAELDLPRLAEERKRSLSLGRRQPEAYGPLLEPQAPGPTEPQEQDFDVRT